MNNEYKGKMVICFEVAEHIDPQYSDSIVKSVYDCIQNGGILLWTAAIPGQGGVGHINCRPKKYWKEKFENIGLVHDDEMQQRLIDYCRQGMHMGWFTQNVLCFHKYLNKK